MAKEKILIVDDDYSSRLFLQKVLERDEYRTTICSDGVEALEILNKSNFDLVITDLKMESIGGIELLEKIKFTNPQVAVIIITGFASIQTAIEALRLGASDYLIKPVNVDELRIRLKKALERRELERKLTEAERRITYNATITTANHEINQPLTVILSAVDMIKMELGRLGVSDSKISNYLQLIYKSGTRIANILRRFREISSPVIQNIPHGMKMINLGLNEEEAITTDKYVLVIEDEENLRHIIKELLENEGYKVILASSAKEGIELYEANKNIIEVVLLDFYLPDINGNEVFKHLKTINPHVKVILTSGFEYDETIQEVMDRGALGFIGKPFNREQILSFISKILKYKSDTN